MHQILLPHTKTTGTHLTGVQQVKVQLTWHPQMSVWTKFFAKLGLIELRFFDLDLVAFLLKDCDKLQHLGDEKLIGGDVIFFNHPQHASQRIWLDRDSRSGSYKGHDETIAVDLFRLPFEYQKVVFMLSLHKGIKNGQDLGQLKEGKILLSDDNDRVWAEFPLQNTPDLHGKCSFLFLELHRKGRGWEFTTPNETFATDNFVNVLQRYVYC